MNSALSSFLYVAAQVVDDLRMVCHQYVIRILAVARTAMAEDAESDRPLRPRKAGVDDRVIQPAAYSLRPQTSVPRLIVDLKVQEFRVTGEPDEYGAKQAFDLSGDIPCPAGYDRIAQAIFALQDRDGRLGLAAEVRLFAKGSWPMTPSTSSLKGCCEIGRPRRCSHSLRIRQSR